MRRALSGRPIGTIDASPNPLTVNGRVGLTTLSWKAEHVREVEIRVGAPDGQLFSRSGPTGSARTGEWVADGMMFFLQNVSNGLELNSDNTLDTVTVRFRTSPRRGADRETPNPPGVDPDLANPEPSEELDIGRYDSGKPALYLQRYETFFRPLRNRSVTLLELGVDRGGSLLLWRDYFERGMIVGLDANDVSLADPTGRIRIYQGLQQDPRVLDRIGLEVAPAGFDVIIDDASHIGAFTRLSFWHLFLNHLKPGGIYVIEDWGTGYWDTWPDGKKFDLLTEWPKGAIADHSQIDERPQPTHQYGLVGFIKQLVDECGLDDLTNEELGAPPARSSRIQSMHISHGQVFIIKK